MLRRDFLKVIGAIGAITILPLGAIASVKEYPKIKYEINYIPDQKMCYLHQVHGRLDGVNWVIFEYTDSKKLPNDIFLRMVEEVNKKVIGR